MDQLGCFASLVGAGLGAVAIRAFIVAKRANEAVSLLTTAASVLPAPVLRCPGESLTLLYGQPDLAAPRYDLALLATRLVGAAAHELVLAPEAGSIPARAGAGTPAKLFWGMLVVAVVAFLALIVRLIKKEPPPSSGAAQP